ncbi:hypothetical protein J2T13_001027, partial [Paenibacillus sp. DS2015]
MPEEGRRVTYETACGGNKDQTQNWRNRENETRKH